MLIGIDGTGSGPFNPSDLSGMLPSDEQPGYYSDMKTSFVRELVQEYHGPWRSNYFRGPTYAGEECGQIAAACMTLVEAPIRSGAPIYLTGYSRGGAIAIEVAKRIRSQFPDVRNPGHGLVRCRGPGTDIWRSPIDTWERRYCLSRAPRPSRRIARLLRQLRDRRGIGLQVGSTDLCDDPWRHGWCAMGVCSSGPGRLRHDRLPGRAMVHTWANFWAAGIWQRRRYGTGREDHLRLLVGGVFRSLPYRRGVAWPAGPDAVIRITGLRQGYGKAAVRKGSHLDVGQLAKAGCHSLTHADHRSIMPIESRLPRLRAFASRAASTIPPPDPVACRLNPRSRAVARGCHRVAAGQQDNGNVSSQTCGQGRRAIDCPMPSVPSPVGLVRYRSISGLSDGSGPGSEGCISAMQR